MESKRISVTRHIIINLYLTFTLLIAISVLFEVWNVNQSGIMHNIVKYIVLVPVLYGLVYGSIVSVPILIVYYIYLVVKVVKVLRCNIQGDNKWQLVTILILIPLNCILIILTYSAVIYEFWW